MDTKTAGKLYIVATPIGNLEDITFRAVRVLQESDVIYAEDTRVTGKLLQHYNITKPIRSYHQHSLISKREEILNALLSGQTVSLVTDAGTPGISDPGNELIDYIYSNAGLVSSAFQVSTPSRDSASQPVVLHAGMPADSVQISPIAGASALTAALSISGFNVNKFLFLGFLPKKKRTKLFEWAKEGQVAIAFFDNPKRLYKTLVEVSEHFGKGSRVLIARELTKVHETLYRGSLSEVMKQIGEQKGGKNNFNLKGEVVVIIEV